MVSAIMTAAGAASDVGGPTTLALAPALQPRVVLPARTLTLSELQRLKRQFVTVHKKAITLGTTEKGAVDWSEGRIAEKFGAYLEENLRP